MSSLLFGDSFVHHSHGPHLDEIRFKHPVTIHSFLVVPPNIVPHPSQLRSFVGVTTPMNFSLEIVAVPYTSSTPSLSKIHGPSSFVDSPAEVTTFSKPETTLHIIIRGGYESLSLCLYGTQVREPQHLFASSASVLFVDGLRNPLTSPVVAPTAFEMQSSVPSSRGCVNKVLAHIRRSPGTSQEQREAGAAIMKLFLDGEAALLTQLQEALAIASALEVCGVGHEDLWELMALEHIITALGDPNTPTPVLQAGLMLLCAALRSESAASMLCSQGCIDRLALILQSHDCASLKVWAGKALAQACDYAVGCEHLLDLNIAGSAVYACAVRAGSKPAMCKQEHESLMHILLMAELYHHLCAIQQAAEASLRDEQPLDHHLAHVLTQVLDRLTVAVQPEPVCVMDHRHSPLSNEAYEIKPGVHRMLLSRRLLPSLAVIMGSCDKELRHTVGHPIKCILLLLCQAPTGLVLLANNCTYVNAIVDLLMADTEPLLHTIQPPCMLRYHRAHTLDSCLHPGDAASCDTTVAITLGLHLIILYRLDDLCHPDMSCASTHLIELLPLTRHAIGRAVLGSVLSMTQSFTQLVQCLQLPQTPSQEQQTAATYAAVLLLVVLRSDQGMVLALQRGAWLEQVVCSTLDNLTIGSELKSQLSVLGSWLAPCRTLAGPTGVDGLLEQLQTAGPLGAGLHCAMSLLCAILRVDPEVLSDLAAGVVFPDALGIICHVLCALGSTLQPEYEARERCLEVTLIGLEVHNYYNTQVISTVLSMHETLWVPNAQAPPRTGLAVIARRVYGMLLGIMQLWDGVRWPCLVRQVLIRAVECPPCGVAAAVALSTHMLEYHTPADRCQRADELAANVAPLTCLVSTYAPSSNMVLSHEIQRLLLHICTLGCTHLAERCVLALLGLLELTGSQSIGPLAAVRVLRLLCAVGRTAVGPCALLDAGAHTMALNLMGNSCLGAHTNVRAAARELCCSVCSHAALPTSILEHMCDAMLSEHESREHSLKCIECILDCMQGAQAVLHVAGTTGCFVSLLKQGHTQQVGVIMLRVLLQIADRWQHPMTVNQWLQQAGCELSLLEGEHTAALTSQVSRLLHLLQSA